MLDKTVEKKDSELDIKKLYTPLSVAKEEIWRRWNDKKLKNKVEEFLNGDVPKFLQEKPKAYLGRHIASPNFEFIRFLESAQTIGLEPVCPEYLQDKFSAANFEKYHLGKIFLHNGKGKKGGDKITTSRIIDFTDSEGKKLEHLKTCWGDSFCGFHHKLLDTICPSDNRIIFDISPWIIRNGKNPELFYSKFFALFICHGVLFENFLLNKGENYFSNNVVIPNFKKIYKKFGIKPLIVPLVPIEKETDIYWWCYPEKVNKLFK